MLFQDVFNIVIFLLNKNEITNHLIPPPLILHMLKYKREDINSWPPTICETHFELEKTAWQGDLFTNGIWTVQLLL